MRAVFAAMAGLLCAAWGMGRAAFMRAEAAELRRFSQLLTVISLLLSEGMLPLPEALLAAADGASPADSLLRAMAARMQADPLLTPAEAYAEVAASPREALARFFARLGRGSLEARRLAAEQAAAELTHAADAADARVQRDAKLFQTLGVTGGATLALLLL